MNAERWLYLKNLQPSLGRIWLSKERGTYRRINIEKDCRKKLIKQFGIRQYKKYAKYQRAWKKQEKARG